VTVEIDSEGSASNWAPAWKAVRAGEVVGFSVDRPEDVDAIVAAVSAAGHRVLQPPHDAFFGARYAVVEDPDGLAVGIMDPFETSEGRVPEVPS